MQAHVHILLHACRHFAAEALLEDTDSVDANSSPGRDPDTAAPDADNSAAAVLAERRSSHAEASTAKAWNTARITQSASGNMKDTILDDSMHPIRQRDIPRGVWTVLLRLRGAGASFYSALCMLVACHAYSLSVYTDLWVWSGPAHTCMQHTLHQRVTQYQHCSMLQGMRGTWWEGLCATSCCKRSQRTTT